MDILQYTTDLRSLILEALVIIDLIAGAIAHTRRDGFSADRFGDWFRTNVIYIVLPYVFALGAALVNLPGAVSGTNWSSGQVVGWLLLIPAVVKVGNSIWENLQLLRAPRVAR